MFDNLLSEIALLNKGTKISTCLNPGPMPPPVVGLQIPAASPNNATLSIIVFFNIPLGTGPQNLPTSLHSENLFFHGELFIKLFKKFSLLKHSILITFAPSRLS